jgi:AcrR family transcriptional regulator
MEGAGQVKRGRGGRPAAGQGDVETRLLAAATRLFLERGYDGTSCDQVALDAGAGKASIYARYANKAALFAAVVDRMLARSFAQDKVAAETPLDERLAAVGMRVLADALYPEALALLRLLVAELPRLVDATVRADQLFWQAGVRRVAGAIALRDPETVGKATGPAEQFIDLVLAPALLRALLGEPTAPLMAAARPRITAAIGTLRANGALAGWS